MILNVYEYGTKYRRSTVHYNVVTIKCLNNIKVNI